MMADYNLNHSELNAGKLYIDNLPEFLQYDKSKDHFINGALVCFCRQGFCTIKINFTLHRITQNNALIILPTHMFYGCSSLTEISIPRSVTTIDSTEGYQVLGGTFEDCTSLAAVTCKWDDPIVPFPDDYYTRHEMFSSQTYADATLYVPIGTKEKYQSVEPWSNFENIEEFEMEDSGVKNVIAEAEPNVSVENGAICVSGDEPVRIVTLGGVTIYSGQGACNVNVDKGMYIVVFGDKASKVAVL